MALLLNGHQVPENGFLDVQKQTYLGNAFSASTKAAATGTTAETPWMLVINPATSGKSMFVFTRRHTIVTTTADTATFRYYIQPTISANGTPITLRNLRANPLSPVSVMSAYSIPTVVANGTFVSDIATTASGNPTEVDTLVILDPGVTVLIQVMCSSATAPVANNVYWYELPYGTGL